MHVEQQKPSVLPEATDIERIESPVLGYAVKQQGDTGRNTEVEKLMGFLQKPPDDIAALGKDFDGLSTAYDSQSDTSEAFSADICDGDMGPADLVVVGRGLGTARCSLSDSHTTIADRFEDLADSFTSESSEAEEACQAGEPPSHPGAVPRSGGWWSNVDMAGVKGLEGASEVATLLDARAVKVKASRGTPAPWAAGQSSDLYTEMGMVDASKCYLAVWLNLGPASLLFVFESADRKWLDNCLEDDFLSKRLKFISNPVQMRGAMPCKSPQEADAVGKFFGKQHTSAARGMTQNGIAYASIQMDVFSKWYVRLAFQQVALRLGNILELLLVDEPSLSVLAGCRLMVTQELLDMLSA